MSKSDKQPAAATSDKDTGMTKVVDDGEHQTAVADKAGPGVTATAPTKDADKNSSRKKKHEKKRQTNNPRQDSLMKKTNRDSVVNAQSSSLVIGLLVIALLTAVAAVASVYWLWQQGQAGTVSLQQQSQQQLDSVLANMTGLQQQLKKAEQQQQAQWLGFEQRQTKELESILTQLSQARDPKWLLAEAEYLLRIANHRLQLVADVDTAISALTLADQRLLSLRDPRLLDLRRQLSDDIARLKALPRIDIAGMALTLASLQQQLEQLPLTGRISLADPAVEMIEVQKSEESKDWQQFFSDVWASLRGLVTVRRIDENSAAIVPPEQRIFLYQNLALKLEAARHALLRNDDALYHQSLTTVRDWIHRYFDSQDSGVQALLSTLQQLDAIRLNIKLPSLAAALESIQAISLDKPTQSKSLRTKNLRAKKPVLPTQSTDQKVLDAATDKTAEENTVESADQSTAKPAVGATGLAP